jgi:two-component system, NarL family, sensor histidine kinase UhpB
VSRLSLFWRVFLTNAVVFAIGTAALVLSPATVSFPLAVTEAIVLVVGLSAMLVANAFLLRLSFRPLERLTALMRKLDLLRPGQRLSVSGAGEVADVIRTFNDMLDRLEAERRASSRRALMAQETERQRIAQELHDEIGQSLTAVILQLKRVGEKAPLELQEQLLEVQEAARASLDEVRQIARRLRPGVLDDLGLVSALTALATSFSEQAGLPVSRRFARSIPPLSREVELVLYRVAQEGLTNVARHANASRAELSLDRSATGVTLRVTDDGRGLDGAIDGDGLRGMRERALLIGGNLRVDSPPRGGVQVLLEVPTSDGIG